jgi:Protein of unknown function (DUF1153)
VIAILSVMDATSPQLDMANIDPLDISPYSPAVELPSPNTKRWVVRRKAVVVAAVRNGTLSLQEACRRYNLSVEEFLAWQRSIDRYGVPGLRVTRLQIYRDTDALRAAK